jgi:hypothetical protein
MCNGVCISPYADEACSVTPTRSNICWGHRFGPSLWQGNTDKSRSQFEGLQSMLSNIVTTVKLLPLNIWNGRRHNLDSVARRLVLAAVNTRQRMIHGHHADFYFIWTGKPEPLRRQAPSWSMAFKLNFGGGDHHMYEFAEFKPNLELRKFS